MKKLKYQLYEGMYVLSATLSDDSRKLALAKIIDGITEKGGEIKKLHDLGRKRLAYSIQKKREGHYYLLYFTAPTAAMADLWREYKLHEDLLRFITLQTNEVKEKLEFKLIKQA